MAAERLPGASVSSFNPCQVLAPLTTVSAGRQCLQGFSAVDVRGDTENGLFDRMAAMLYSRRCAFPLLQSQGSPAPCMPDNGPYSQTGRPCRTVCQLKLVVHLAASCAGRALSVVSTARPATAKPPNPPSPFLSRETFRSELSPFPQVWQCQDRPDGG